MSEEAASSKRPTYWADTRFVARAPHRGLDGPRWKGQRAGRKVRVSMPTQREKLDERVRKNAEDAGCECEMFWVMHPGDAQSSELFAQIIYVCQAQIESD